MSTIRTRTRLMLALAAMATMMFGLSAAPASADPVTVVVEGNATLFDGTLACGEGEFRGTANGTHGQVPIVNRPVTAEFTYCNDLAAGTADGTITITGIGTCGFSWERTGNTAAITFSGGCTGTATAVFTPTSPPGTLPGTATIVAEGTVETHP